jgi:hypothetical protein
VRWYSGQRLPVPVPLRGAGQQAAAAAKAARFGSCGAPSAVCLDGLLGGVVGCVFGVRSRSNELPLVEYLLSVLYSSMNAATSHLAWARVSPADHAIGAKRQ